MQSWSLERGEENGVEKPEEMLTKSVPDLMKNINLKTSNTSDLMISTDLSSERSWSRCEKLGCRAGKLEGRGLRRGG